MNNHAKYKTVLENNLYIGYGVAFFIILTIDFAGFVDTVSNVAVKNCFDGMAQGTSYTAIVVSVLILLGMMIFSGTMRTLLSEKVSIENEK